MKLLLLLFSVIFVIGECKIAYRNKRAVSILESACKRFPYLGFCNDEHGNLIYGHKDTLKMTMSKQQHLSLTSSKTQKSLPSKTSSQQKSAASMPIPFDTEQFGNNFNTQMDALTKQDENANLQKIKMDNTDQKSDAASKLIKFDTEQFNGREGVEDFDRIDQMHAQMKNQKLQRHSKAH